VTVVPLKEGFENPKAFLLHIAEDEEIEGFVICVLRKTGTMIPAQINMSRADMAYAGAVITAMALEDGE